MCIEMHWHRIASVDASKTAPFVKVHLDLLLM